MIAIALLGVLMMGAMVALGVHQVKTGNLVQELAKKAKEDMGLDGLTIKDFTGLHQVVDRIPGLSALQKFSLARKIWAEVEAILSPPPEAQKAP